MIEILLSTIISCSDAQRLILNLEKVKDLPRSVKMELLHEIKEASPRDCKLPKI
tara:strand:+ start:382 stop:543 length:162 start_codon:yes stop_codon:yes gene_type:complete